MYVVGNHENGHRKPRDMLSGIKLWFNQMLVMMISHLESKITFPCYCRDTYVILNLTEVSFFMNYYT